MPTKSDIDDDDTSIGSTEMQALRRIAEPLPEQVFPQQDELWAGRYRIIESIGRGAMGDVFLARDVLLDRPVALKILRTTSEESVADARKVLREARTGARAEHERVARIYDVGTSSNQAYIAMEYVRGETLRVWMKGRRPSARDVIAIIQQLLAGLKALHERGIVHRDLKPENVMVTPEGHLRILDLGIARRVAIPSLDGHAHTETSTSLGFGVGTPAYMAPEQWRRSDVDARADIFALGVIAYELVTSCNPFRGGAAPEIRERTLHGEISFDEPDWQEFPASFRSAVRIALARDPEQRHQDAEAFAAALGISLTPSLPPVAAPSLAPSSAPLETASSSGSLKTTAVEMASRAPASKRPRWLPLGGVVAIAVVVGAGLSWRMRRSRLPPTPGMVQFDGASYAMGLDRAELERECNAHPNGCLPEAANETPPRPVNVAPFELDEREVTNEEFAAFLTQIGPLTSLADDDNHHVRFVRYRPGPGDDYLLYDLFERLAGIRVTPPSAFSARPDFQNLPVTLVTWLGAHLYCRSVGKRLPTEGEWELAARGIERRPYPWGAEPPTCAGLHIPSRQMLAVRDAVIELPDPDQCDNARTIPFPVMSAPRDKTPQGIFDLAGNVLEWTDDDALLDDRSATLATRASADRPGIIRGGAFSSSFGVRTTTRFFWVANNVGDNIGFRCAKSITR